AFHSQTPIVAYAADSISKHGIDRTALLRPVGVSFFGEGSPLHSAGVPTIGFVPGPNYLLSFADDQHIEKVDTSFLYKQIEWTADLLHTLDTVPKAILEAGDSALLPARLGAEIPIE